MKVHVCNFCGSPRVYADALQNLNDEDDVRLFDDTFCSDCAQECKTIQVDVSEEFDITEHWYEL